MNNSDCIVTERLVLRRFAEGDEQAVFALMSDPYICEMAGIKTFESLDMTRKFMQAWRHGAYAITERGSDTVIGVIQVVCNWWEDRVELGYWLAEEYRGRGYMTEAVEAMKEYVFEEMFFDEIRIYVFSGNEASSKVALKCGFFPKYDAYKENVYSPFGKVESEECFTITRGDYEWERRGNSFYSTDSLRAAA